MGITKTFAGLACTLAVTFSQATPRPEDMTPGAREFYTTLVGMMRHNQIMAAPLAEIDRADMPEVRRAYEKEFSQHRVELAGLRGRLRDYGVSEQKLPAQTCTNEVASYFAMLEREKRLEAFDRAVNEGKIPGPVMRDMTSYNYAQQTRQAHVWLLNNRCEL